MTQFFEHYQILWKIPNEDIFVLNKELALKENLITES